MSIVAQTHNNFECIIVDDHSEQAEFESLSHTIEQLQDARFKLVRLEENVGQIRAIFEGLRHTDADFVALLDPDDWYEPGFLEEMLHAHLNPVRVAAVAACNMGLFRVGRGRLTGNYVRHYGTEPEQTFHAARSRLTEWGYSEFFPAWKVGWLWGTTSGLMFRRDALELVRPDDSLPDTRFHGDSYCVYGAHMLGGTLYVDKVLSWRGIHDGNTAETDRVFSHFQKRHKDDFVDVSHDMKKAAMRAYIGNAGWKGLTNMALGEILTSHFTGEELAKWCEEDPAMAQVILRFGANAS